jgi:hypothetical protein
MRSECSHSLTIIFINPITTLKKRGGKGGRIAAGIIVTLLLLAGIAAGVRYLFISGRILHLKSAIGIHAFAPFEALPCHAMPCV